MLKPHFQEFAAYNQWATANLYDALAPLPAEDLSRDVGVFFGSIIGTLIGALIVGIFRNGLTLMGVPSIYQWLITGVLVILAVSVDQLTQRRRS